VADRRHRLSGVDEVPDETDCGVVGPKGIRVGHASGKHQCLIVVDLRLLNGSADRERFGLVQMVEGLHSARLGGEQHRRESGVHDGLPGTGQFNPLDALDRGEEGNFSIAVLCHPPMLRH